MKTLKEYQDFCVGKPFVLGPMAGRIIEAIVDNGETCTTQPGVPCPCPTHEADIASRGMCRCILFFRRNES